MNNNSDATSKLESVREIDAQLLFTVREGEPLLYEWQSVWQERRAALKVKFTEFTPRYLRIFWKTQLHYRRFCGLPCVEPLKLVEGDIRKSELGGAKIMCKDLLVDPVEDTNYAFLAAGCSRVKIVGLPPLHGVDTTGATAYERAAALHARFTSTGQLAHVCNSALSSVNLSTADHRDTIYASDLTFRGSTTQRSYRAYHGLAAAVCIDSELESRRGGYIEQTQLPASYDFAPSNDVDRVRVLSTGLVTPQAAAQLRPVVVLAQALSFAQFHLRLAAKLCTSFGVLAAVLVSRYLVINDPFGLEVEGSEADISRCPAGLSYMGWNFSKHKAMGWDLRYNLMVALFCIALDLFEFAVTVFKFHANKGVTRDKAARRFFNDYLSKMAPGTRPVITLISMPCVFVVFCLGPAWSTFTMVLQRVPPAPTTSTSTTTTTA